MKILVTGAAGFIGMHLSEKLLSRGDTVIGVDNLNDYYDVGLKLARLEKLSKYPLFLFEKQDIVNKEAIDALFQAHSVDQVVHLAAQAGVRYSIENPMAYIDSNINGFVNILEACKTYQVNHLIYASSSSVFGGNTRIPFSEEDNVDHPVSLYAATKKSNELMAHVYSHLFGLPTTGLRFFTVYGPWGRPDMALYKFAKAMLEDRPIDVYNNGELWRDFTYIDDIVEGVVRVMLKVPVPQPEADHARLSPAVSWAPYQVFNIGRSEPVKVNDMIAILETALGKKAKRNVLPMQPGDVHTTYCDTRRLTDAIGYAPQTDLSVGIERFVAWFRDYHKPDVPVH